MVSFSELQSALIAGRPVEYQCQTNLNLYDSPELKDLATQAVAGRQLRIVSLSDQAALEPQDSLGAVQNSTGAVKVCLCEDDYPGWLPLEDLDLLSVAEENYRAIAISPSKIQARLPRVITFARKAMTQPNHYLWGGTVGPNYDCSGLVQTAFAAVGIWLPRDAYQQEAFVQPIAVEELQPGDLVFFGSRDRCTHVGLYLGEEGYIHSSGKAIGRNGIGIDPLSAEGGAIAKAYYHQLRGAGRVIASYKSPDT
ncbi:C40 family peptidase [Leptolyngbya sp. FACHB-671]|uniref:C40 family peptidase n=1 Tax=Leptolyngbya sp. FACHB-671 TaxID=2692812 RepID=UPI00168873F1|nr:C40 family peptidase [Leptolyngbya sp. FACHB-671]MBD2066582.1 C40 family peptidase [Leptolyngbya sp. FACHB-671]